MEELQELINNLEESIALHKRVCKQPLMYTKDTRLKNSHYAQALSKVLEDLKKITNHDVVSLNEELEKFADWVQSDTVNLNYTAKEWVDEYLTVKITQKPY